MKVDRKLESKREIWEVFYFGLVLVFKEKEGKARKRDFMNLL